VVLATGGYGTVYYLSTLALGCNASAAWKAYKKGACIASPSFTQIHPTCIPAAGEHQSKLTLMSESLRNDGRIWAPKAKGDQRPAGDIPEDERDYYLERKYPSYGNLAPRDVSSRAAKEVCDAGHGVGPTGLGVYLDFSDALARDGRDAIAARYGNLFEMYSTITGESPYEVPMRIYPAAHFTMGGLWVDYNLMTTTPGLYAIGECNFADHGANRLGANSLLQACVDGYFVIPYTLGDYLADDIRTGPIATEQAAFDQAESAVRERIDRLLAVGGKTSPRTFHKRLGGILWDRCGMVRNAKGLKSALADLTALREEFWRDLRVTGRADTLNPELERAGRVADFLELGELIVRDALDREESCGAHFREEHQTQDGEALRNDEVCCYVSVWEHRGEDSAPKLNREHLQFENVELAVRSYK
jgi:succinate dehydrogenase / fumarate reductase flavoprotein subunit